MLRSLSAGIFALTVKEEIRMDEIKKSWCKHEFTEEELKVLYSGGGIRLDDCITMHGNRFGCFII